MSKHGDEIRKLVHPSMARVGESCRLLGMAQALTEVGIYACGGDKTADEIIAWCAWKCHQVSEEHRREFEGGEDAAT